MHKRLFVGQRRLGGVLWAKVELAQEQAGGDNAPQLVGRVQVETALDEGSLTIGKLLLVIPPWRQEATSASEVGKILGLRHAECARLLGILADHVTDVISPLHRPLRHHARLLQEVCLDVCAAQLALLVELQHEELAITRRVVVHGSLGVAKCFEHRGRGEDTLLDTLLTFDRLCSRVRQVLEHLLRRLRLARARLARDYDGL